MFWGWASDRFGRVLILCWTVATYSLFTAASGLATGVVMFAAFRFLTGFGVGGEWAAGTPLLHESVPERSRVSSVVCFTRQFQQDLLWLRCW